MLHVAGLAPLNALIPSHLQVEIVVVIALIPPSQFDPLRSLSSHRVYAGALQSPLAHDFRTEVCPRPRLDISYGCLD